MDRKISHVVKVTLDLSELPVLYFLAALVFSIWTPVFFNSYSVKVNFKIKGRFMKWKNTDHPVPDSK